MKVGQRFAGTVAVVGEACPAHAERLILPAHTSDVRVFGCLVRGVENDYRSRAEGDYLSASEADPLALVLAKQLVARGPVLGLVLAPVVVDLASDFGREAVGEAFHG
jgi:hypothetical protein